MKVEIYSDVVCPWCYVGERRFGRALAAHPRAEAVEVVFRPYQLDPDAPETAEPLTEYLRRRFGRGMEGARRQVTEAARGEGIEVAWERALSVNTRRAHRLLMRAERQDGPEVQRALAERLFDAHFARGLDLGDAEALAVLAEAAGMDRARARAFLESDEGEEALEAELAAARRLGVRAVPTFVFDGRYVVQGAQSVAVFLEVLEEVERRAAGAPEEGGEGCADGSCAA